jgi:serine/threonine protein kinase
MGTPKPLDLLGPFQIPLQIDINTHAFTIPTKFLPKQYIDYSLRVPTGIRCKLRYTDVVNRGGYGSILLANRIDLSGNSQEICVKAPHTSGFSLCPEAIIQWMASDALIHTGIVGAIPLVHDIFQYAGETRFSMSYVKGVSCVTYILDSPTPERALVEILVQVSLLLGYLEETIHLDHRDLKADNIWIRLEPVDYSITLSGHRWKYKAPVQVVLLDFGFSCLGDSKGLAVVSLSDGILPRIDPCPKEGRDLFQLISSIASLPQIRQRISAALCNDIELLLSYRNKPYIDLLRKNLSTTWVYLVVSDLNFNHPPLHPLSLLHMLRIKYPYVDIQCE